MKNFKDETIACELEKKGFAVTPFLTTEEIKELLEFYHSLPKNEAGGTQVTMFNPSYTYRKSVDDKIKQIGGLHAQGLTNGYKVLYTNFMVKEPGPEGDFPVHQDWTYVNEPEYLSYALWIPLQDVSAENGALHVVENSHRLNTGLRGPHIHEPFQHYSGLLKQNYSQVVSLKAGEALIWDHRLVHFSLPNLSAAARIAITLIMVPVNATVLHYIGRPYASQIDELKVDTEFYLNYEIGKVPATAQIIRTVNQDKEHYSEKYLADVLQ